MVSQPPYRLALVITELDVGGAERCLVNLALRLDRRRFTPVVYSLGPPPSPTRSLLIDQLTSGGVTVHFLGATSIWQAVSAHRRLLRHFTEQPPDLVQTFLFHANVLGSRAARRAGVRHVVWGVRVADPSPWRQLVERRAVRSVDRIACVSDAVADFVRQRIAVPAEQVIVIPNGIDLTGLPATPASDASLGLLDGRRAISVVARLHPQKGLDWLLQVAPRVLREFADVDLLVVGHGPQQAELEQLARQLGIASRVHFLGWRADVPRILARSSLLVLPSRWEGMPNAVLEAMANGLPVVATRAEGVVELLGNESAPEQLVDWGDSDSLAARLIQLLREPDRAHQLGLRNRRRANERFSLDRMVNSYQQLYVELLDRSASIR